ncbi:inverse autotransporter beta domain-containing protein, partial [Escherichia coli]
NTFIDHDLSRSHTRIGVGAEYWRDYLKLSANGYIRASGWKKSPDIEDYQERPANGWDRFSGGGREDYCNNDGYPDGGSQSRRRKYVGRH